MEYLKLHVEGHVLITDPDSGEVILNRRNSVHRENMSFALASAISNTKDVNGITGIIANLAYGNGGVVIDGSGNVTYNAVNVIDNTAELYHQTYTKAVNYSIIDNQDNNSALLHTNGTTYTDIVITSTLDYGEPLGQDPLDDTSNQEGDFVFDEIGLVSQQGRLLTHLIFHPVQKSANRKIQIVYTVRISAG